MICHRCHRPVVFNPVHKSGHVYHPACAEPQRRPIAGRKLQCERGAFFVAKTNYNNGCPKCAEIYRRTCDGRQRHLPVGTAELRDGLGGCGKGNQKVADSTEPWWRDSIRRINALLAGAHPISAT